MVATRNDRGIHVQDFDGRQSKSDGPKQVGAQPRWRPYTIARPSVKPDEAEQAMRNDPLDMNYEVIDGEQRWTSLGHTGNFRVLLLVWTVRHDALRIVTARAIGTRARDAYLRAKGLLT